MRSFRPGHADVSPDLDRQHDARSESQAAGGNMGDGRQHHGQRVCRSVDTRYVRHDAQDYLRQGDCQKAGRRGS